MTKSSEYEHHIPRTIQKNKKKKVFNEEATLENRGSRVSFKNYIRQVREDELDEEQSTTEWTVMRGVKDYEDTWWSEVATFPSEEEAEEYADDCRDKESDFDVSYKVEEV